MKKIKHLALVGGDPILKTPYDPAYTIDGREMSAVARVMKKGPLSDFAGSYGSYFLGGTHVRRLEHNFCKYFKVTHAVSFNSATAALHAAITALGIGPGDEVIVSPYTMSASAMCILMNGAIPVFADIDRDTFCVDPNSIRRKISKRTKALLIVNLFGQPADFKSIMKIARKQHIPVIEDNAQAAGARYAGEYAGTIGDIGVFSFNVHKTIQSGEGGVLVTNNSSYALRAQLMRNHGESVIADIPRYNAGAIIGSNYRMTEVEAAIAIEQLKKLSMLNQRRIELAKYLSSKLRSIRGLQTPHMGDSASHVYYVYAIKVAEDLLGIKRDVFVDAMTAEGFPLSKGYVKPLYFLPVFRNRRMYPRSRFPFDQASDRALASYLPGSCSVTERMYFKELTFTTICHYPHTKRHIDLFVKAIKKIITYKHELPS